MRVVVEELTDSFKIEKSTRMVSFMDALTRNIAFNPQNSLTSTSNEHTLERQQTCHFDFPDDVRADNKSFRHVLESWKHQAVFEQKIRAVFHEDGFWFARKG